MATVPRKRRGSKPAGRGAPAPKLDQATDLPPARARELALQQAPVNAVIWGIVRDGRDLHDRLRKFLNDGPDEDEALAALAAAGLPPAPNGAPSGPGTFDCVSRDFEVLADALRDHLTISIGDLPPPPVAERRAA